MKLKYGVLLLGLLIFFTGCSQGAYKPYVEAIEKSETLTAEHQLWVTAFTGSSESIEQEVMASPLVENYSEVRHYWAKLLDANSVSEKDKSVVKTPRGNMKVTRYKVHPSSERVEAFEIYLKEQNLMSAHGRILSYEEEGLVDLDGYLLETRVSLVLESEGKKEKWKMISQYGYELEKGGQ